MISLYVDELGEALVQTISTLSSSLGLQSVEQGDWTRLPAPEDLNSSLPCVLVSFLRTDIPELRMHRVRIIYHFRVRYFRRQKYFDENPARETNRAACEIWSAISNHTEVLGLRDSLTPAFFSDDVPDGCVYESIHASGPTMENADNEAMNLAELRVNVAWVDVQITCTSRPYTPS